MPSESSTRWLILLSSTNVRWLSPTNYWTSRLPPSCTPKSRLIQRSNRIPPRKWLHLSWHRRTACVRPNTPGSWKNIVQCKRVTVRKKHRRNLSMAVEYKDYYKILGVNKDEDEKEIRQAYRKLARQYK